MKPTLVRCPQCSQSLLYRIDNPSRPFCSPRCKLLDLGAWAEARYAIAGPTATAEATGFEHLNATQQDTPTTLRRRPQGD